MENYITNGFASENQYKKTLEMLNDIYTFSSEYFSVTFDQGNKVLEITVDDYRYDIWDGTLEIAITNPKVHMVYGDYVEISFKLKEMIDDGKFDFIFSNE